MEKILGNNQLCKLINENAASFVIDGGGIVVTFNKTIDFLLS